MTLCSGGAVGADACWARAGTSAGFPVEVMSFQARRHIDACPPPRSCVLLTSVDVAVQGHSCTALTAARVRLVPEAELRACASALHGAADALGRQREKLASPLTYRQKLLLRCVFLTGANAWLTDLPPPPVI